MHLFSVITNLDYEMLSSKPDEQPIEDNKELSRNEIIYEAMMYRDEWGIITIKINFHSLNSHTPAPLHDGNCLLMTSGNANKRSKMMC